MKKQSIFVLVFCLLGVHTVKSQGEFNTWYFGSKAGVDFNPGFPVTLLNCSNNGTSTQTCISDSAGNLLFYCNNLYAINNHHTIMPNGSGLLGTGQGMGRQGILAIQSPSDDSLYYVFTCYGMGIGWFTYGLRYSLLDMRLDNKLGDIIPGQKNLVIPAGTNAAGALTATRHANNHDAWIVTRKWGNGNPQLYVAFLLTESGLDTVPVYSNSTVFMNHSSLSHEIRCIKISPNATRLACVYDDMIEYCAFNSQTGHITPLFTFRQTNYVSY